MSGVSGRSQLHSLARLKGLQTSFFNVLGERIQASDDSLVALLHALGVDASSDEACEQSLRTATRLYWERIIEPVVVAWDGIMPRFEVRTRASESLTPRVEIETDNGDIHTYRAWDLNIDSESGSKVEGTEFRRLRINTGERLPTGYHALRVTSGARSEQATIISAPRRCFSESDGQMKKWGLFAPAYSLRGVRDIGTGSYRDLADLSEWTASLGGSFVGTLPLLPINPDDSAPSPYLPLTRLFWSDFYIDLESIPFLNSCPETLGIMQTVLGNALKIPEEPAHLVDYEQAHKRKSLVLEMLWKEVRNGANGIMAEMESYLEANPAITDFARDRSERAASEAHSDGPHRRNATSGTDVGYYEFVQWLADTQMRAWSKSRAEPYIDLPVGVHPDGYDARRYSSCFLRDTSCGAPPDSVFTTGQNWGAPPLNPSAIRDEGYKYFRNCLSHHMGFARILRIDHVMGLHRMFCIPHGFEANAGTYLRYKAEELYSLISVESHRHGTTVVGEDLGTVPREVPRAMKRHGVKRMFVLYYELERIAAGEMPRITQESMASLNTHDMPTMAATWRGLDIGQQIELGILSPEMKEEHLARRARAREKLLGLLPSDISPDSVSLEEVLAAILAWMGHSRARYVMASVDDLVLATEQPNVPGIGSQRPNWRFRLQRTVPELQDDAGIAGTLLALNRERTGQVGRRKSEP